MCVSEVGPASVMVGNLVAGKRMAQASGRDLSNIDDNEQVNKVCVCFQGRASVCHYCCVTGYSLSLVFQFLFLSEVLQWRAQTTPDHILYTLINSRVTGTNTHSHRYIGLEYIISGVFVNVFI